MEGHEGSRVDRCRDLSSSAFEYNGVIHHFMCCFWLCAKVCYRTNEISREQNESIHDFVVFYINFLIIRSVLAHG